MRNIYLSFILGIINLIFIISDVRCTDLTVSHLNLKDRSSCKTEIHYNGIDVNDRNDVQLICDLCFKTYPFAYTLFGDKPISFATISDTTEPSIPLLKLDEFEVFIGKTLSGQYVIGGPEILKIPTLVLKRQLYGLEIFVNTTLIEQRQYCYEFKKSWETFNKYCQFFNKELFLFLRKSSTLLLINKLAVKHQIAKHLDLFQSILGTEFSSEFFFHELEHSDTDLHALLKANQTLLGILLGFGKHNSELFQERDDLYCALNSLDYVRDYQEIVKINKKIDCIWNILQRCNDYCRFGLMMRCIPQYVSDNLHPESILLEKKYLLQSRKIKEILSSPDWIEQILCCLTSTASN